MTNLVEHCFNNIKISDEFPDKPDDDKQYEEPDVQSPQAAAKPKVGSVLTEDLISFTPPALRRQRSASSSSVINPFVVPAPTPTPGILSLHSPVELF
jgi:hypothetical protein